MRNVKYILIISLFISLLGCDKYDIRLEQADSFVKEINSGDYGAGIDVKVFNNTYLVLANVVNENQQDIVLLQTNNFGNIGSNVMDTLSSVRGGTNSASKLLLTPDGGFIVLGTVEDTLNNNTDIFIKKFTSEKTIDWEQIIGTNDNETAAAIQKTYDGYIIAGSTDAQDIGNGNAKGSLDIYLVKIDEQGSVLWDANQGGSGDEYANDVITIDNGYLIVGTTNWSNNAGQAKDNIIVVKMKSNGGSPPDVETYGSSNNDYGNSIIKSDDGGFIILGTVEDVTGSKSDIYVLKIGTDIHEIIWNHSFGDAGSDDLGYELIQSNEDYIIIGSKELGTGYAGYFLKIDSEGNDILENTYGGYGQTLNSIEKTTDGGFIMVGKSGAEGSEMISLIKVNSEGEL